MAAGCGSGEDRVLSDDEKLQKAAQGRQSYGQGMEESGRSGKPPVPPQSGN
jgi:hypothetical protein